MKRAYIICAAIYYDDGKERKLQPRNIKTGIVICGWRHENCISNLAEVFPNRDYIINNKEGDKTIQGFLTNEGDFVDRKEGSRIAFEAGQTTKNDGCLFSEDLY